jgi:hypothetical protein
LCSCFFDWLALGIDGRSWLRTVFFERSFTWSRKKSLKDMFKQVAASQMARKYSYSYIGSILKLRILLSSVLVSVEQLYHPVQCTGNACYNKLRRDGVLFGLEGEGVLPSLYQHRVCIGFSLAIVRGFPEAHPNNTRTFPEQLPKRSRTNPERFPSLSRLLPDANSKQIRSSLEQLPKE